MGDTIEDAQEKFEKRVEQDGNAPVKRMSVERWKENAIVDKAVNGEWGCE